MKHLQKNFPLFIFSLFFMILLVSCKDEKEEPAPDLGPSSSEIRLDMKFLDFEAEGGSEEVDFDAGTNWKVITASESWLKVSPTEGKNGKSQTLLIDVSKNEENGERKAQIIVKALSGSSADTLTVRQSGISRYVKIDWGKDAKLTHFDLKSGDVKVDFSDQAPRFTPEVSSIVIPTDSMSYIRVVKSVTTSGKSVTLKTVEGNMTDVFMDQEFTLSTVPTSKTYTTRSGAIQTTDDKGVFHPVRIYEIQEDGRREVIYDVYKEAETRAVYDDVIHANFFYWGKDFTGDKLYDKDGVTLQWDKARFDASIDGQFYFNFGSAVKKLPGGTVEVPFGELYGFFYVLEGSIKSDYLLHLIAESKHHKETETPLVLIDHVFKPVGKFFVFDVYGVPVLITVDPSIKGKSYLHTEARADFLAGFNADVSLKVGVNYNKGDDVKKLEPKLTPRFNLYKPELRVRGKAETSVSIYPDINIRFYNFAGFDVQFIPTLGDEFNFGGVAGGYDENYAAWTNRMYQQLDIYGNLSLDFIGRPWKSPALRLGGNDQIDLFRAPEEIRFIAPEEHAKVGVGETVTAEVEVKDYCLVGKQTPVENAFVKFEALKGVVNVEHAITDRTGRTKVNYTPKEKGSCLIARIVDADGKEISSAVFAPEVEKIETSLWAADEFEITMGGIDGSGASGKWRNVVEFRSDGTYSYIENPTRKILQWTSLGLPNTLSIYRYCKGTYLYDEENKTLTFEAGPIVNESLLNGKPFTTLGYNSMYDIFGKSATCEVHLNEDGTLAIQNGDHYVNFGPLSSYDELKQFSVKTTAENELPKRSEKITVDASGKTIRQE